MVLHTLCLQTYCVFALARNTKYTIVDFIKLVLYTDNQLQFSSDRNQCYSMAPFISQAATGKSWCVAIRTQQLSRYI